MTDMPQNPSPRSTLTQVLVTFVIPIVILTKYSADSELGATKALLLALAFPVVFEIYSFTKRRKASMLSLLAIGGILVTGLISLLGLSEGWLAIRRSVPYLAVAVVIVGSMLIKHPLINALLSQVLDMKEVTKQAIKQRRLPELEGVIVRAGLMIAILFCVITMVSYVLTRVVIVSPTDTASFNQEYARLRLYSLPAVMAPLFVGVVIIISYLASRIENITGLSLEQITKSNKAPKK